MQLGNIRPLISVKYSRYAEPMSRRAAYALPHLGTRQGSDSLSREAEVYKGGDYLPFFSIPYYLKSGFRQVLLLVERRLH